MKDIRVQILDTRGYDPKAVEVAHHLGTTDPADYKRIATWIKDGNYKHFRADALVDIYEREVGPSEGLHDDSLPSQVSRPG